MGGAQRTSIAREYLDVLVQKRTPDIIEIDSDLKVKNASPDRPWPFTCSEEAAAHFRAVAGSNKKYAEVKVTTDHQVVRLVVKR